MDNNFDNQFTNDLKAEPARPQFLKVLCILSFIMCGLMIIVYLVGTFLLGVSEETAAVIVEKMQEASPNIRFDSEDGLLHAIGMASLFGLLANIASLVGVVMMWKLNRIGFFIYAIAEIAVNFVGMDVNAGAEGEKSYGGLIFTIILDLAFIIMYAVNLKYMKKQAAIQAS
jgi:hypothetical protein